MEYEWRRREKAGTLKHRPVKKTQGEKGKGPASAGQGSKSVNADTDDSSGDIADGDVAERHVGERTGAGADILKLFLAKAPRRMQGPVCWAETLADDAELDVAVDAVLEAKAAAAKVEGKPAPPRQGVKNALASKRYNELDAETKAAVRQRVEDKHKENLAKWRSRQSVEPQSPEEAAE